MQVKRYKEDKENQVLSVALPSITEIDRTSLKVLSKVSDALEHKRKISSSRNNPIQIDSFTVATRLDNLAHPTCSRENNLFAPANGPGNIAPRIRSITTGTVFLSPDKLTDRTKSK